MWQTPFENWFSLSKNNRPKEQEEKSIKSRKDIEIYYINDVYYSKWLDMYKDKNVKKSINISD